MFFEDDRPGGDGKGKSWGNAGALAECERLGVEGAELTAALSSSTDNTNVVAVSVSDRRVEAAAFVEAGRQAVGGGIVVLVANTANEPMPFTLRISPSSVADGPAAVLFAARNVSVRDGVLRDWVDAMGTRAYRLRPSTATEPTISPNRNNLLFNPSFENSATTDFPDAFAVMVGNDSEAAVFVDSRDSVHGLHSLRLHTPANGGALQVITYPVEAATTFPPFGRNYSLSLWARGVGLNGVAPKLRFGCPYYDWYPWQTSGVPCPDGPKASCHEFSLVVELTPSWRRYELNVSSPDHALSGDTSWVFVQLEGVGKALVDLFELIER